MLTVHCPTCEAALRLGEEMAGQQVRCGGCQEVFLVEAPAAPRRRDDDDEEDRPRRRPAARRYDDEDDYDDRPSRRRSRRRDDEYDDDDYDDEPRRRRRKKRKKKAAPGLPGLAMTAAILFLIWGGIGAIYTIYSIVGLVTLLDLGAPASFVLGGLVGVIVAGVFSGYLISSGLSILNGRPEDIASIGVAVLSICGAVLVLWVGLLALRAPVFAFELALSALLRMLIGMSGIIVGGIFCLVVSEKYEKWQAS